MDDTRCSRSLITPRQLVDAAEPAGADHVLESGDPYCVLRVCSRVRQTSAMRTIVAIVLLGLGSGCIAYQPRRTPVTDVTQRGRGGERPWWGGLVPCGDRRDTLATRARPDSACITPDLENGPAIVPGTRTP